MLMLKNLTLTNVIGRFYLGVQICAMISVGSTQEKKSRLLFFSGN
jgi:hypothetical protein